LKIAIVFSIKCSSNLLPHGFDIDGLYETQGLTGSESGFFNTARGLAALGHHVDAYCFTGKEVLNCAKLDGANVLPVIANNKMPKDYDAIIAWNDPTHLPLEKTRTVRICSQQLNDFSLAHPSWDKRTDFYAFPSELHRQYVVERENVNPEKTLVIPNSTNIEFFDPNAEKKPGSMIYCSSPDRGLHWLLDIFPEVRKRVPYATLKVFYRFWPWFEIVKNAHDLIGARARHIMKRFKQLGENGENGLYLVGPVPNMEIAKELSSAKILAFPCATIRFTEGFSISTLDGCAAGCLPVISDADALGSIYRGSAVVIDGPPRDRIAEWVDVISRLLSHEEERKPLADRAVKFAEKFSRQNVALMWEKFILEKLGT